MRKEIFRGVATALITPFKDGEIDYNAMRRLIDMQIENEIDALVIGGTTGESATLKENERDELYAFCADYIGGRVKLILGIGSNDTETSVDRAKRYNSLSHDGYLVVTPYYNKGTREGIREHFKKTAAASSHPIILYNVPSRTGAYLSLSDIDTLSEQENIVAIKEAEDSAKRLVALSARREKICLYAGCDTQIYTSLALGGLGVISVISNLYPREVGDICRAYFRGDLQTALKSQVEFLPFIEKMFSETNPAPIKWAMSKAGLCENELRLPMKACEFE